MGAYESLSSANTIKSSVSLKLQRTAITLSRSQSAPTGESKTRRLVGHCNHHTGTGFKVGSQANQAEGWNPNCLRSTLSVHVPRQSHAIQNKSSETARFQLARREFSQDDLVCFIFHFHSFTFLFLAWKSSLNQFNCDPKLDVGKCLLPTKQDAVSNCRITGLQTVTQSRLNAPVPWTLLIEYTERGVQRRNTR